LGKTTLFGTICATIVQPLFRVEHPENDHHNDSFPTGLLDAKFSSQVNYFGVDCQRTWLSQPALLSFTSGPHALA
jgi:hypothetical protein